MTITISQNPLQHEPDVGRPLAEPPHEVREPLLAERHVDPHPVALGAERGLQIAPNPVEHLELVAIRGDGALPRVGLDGVDHLLVVGREGGKRVVVEQPMRQRDVGVVHVAHPLIGDTRRLAIGALHQPHARAERVQPVDVGGAARQTGLDHGADVAMAQPPHGLEHAQRRLGVGRVLHVDADEEPVAGGRLEDAPQVVGGGRPVDVQTQLGELQREVALHARARSPGRSIWRYSRVAASASSSVATLSPR